MARRAAALACVFVVGCAATATEIRPPPASREIPLSAARLVLGQDVLVIGAADSVSVVMEEDYRSFKKGDRLTVFFADGKPWLRVEGR